MLYVKPSNPGIRYVVMKYVRYALVTLVVLLFSMLLPTAEAIDITDINDKVVKNLQTDFQLSTAPDQKKLAKSKWNCQLFGMRSRLQSTKKPSFYKFTVKKEAVKNSGSQIIKEYKATKTGLTGQTGPLFDEVRATQDGRLIGEISIKEKTEKTPLLAKNAKVKSIARSGNEVIAYSVCN